MGIGHEKKLFLIVEIAAGIYPFGFKPDDKLQAVFVGIVGNRTQPPGKAFAEPEIANAVGKSLVKPCGVQPKRVNIFKLFGCVNSLALTVFGCPGVFFFGIANRLKIPVKALYGNGHLEVFAQTGFRGEVLTHDFSEFASGFGGIATANDQN